MPALSGLAAAVEGHLNIDDLLLSLHQSPLSQFPTHGLTQNSNDHLWSHMAATQVDLRLLRDIDFNGSGVVLCPSLDFYGPRRIFRLYDYLHLLTSLFLRLAQPPFQRLALRLHDFPFTLHPRLRIRQLAST
jgi:hypothetical protein